MSERSCRVPTPEQRQFMEFRDAAEKAMLDTIYQAIDAAAFGMAENLKAAGSSLPPTNTDYFTFAAQQVLFVRLCGGDPDTFKGGDPEIGAKIVRNGQYIIDHHWCGDDKT